MQYLSKYMHAVLVLAIMVASPLNSVAQSNGALDATFGPGGTVTTNFGGASDFARSIAVQQDGKIVAAGGANINGVSGFSLARYNSNGTLDASFGAGGRVTVPGGSITNNNKIWTKVVFSPVQTTQVRVLVKGSLANYSRITEIEAWGPTGS